MRSLLLLWGLLLWPLPSPAQPSASGQDSVSPAQAQALVAQALAAELRAAQDAGHPMRYLLRKSSPRFTSTKEIVETRDGDVARLLAIGDKPLNPADEQWEQARLDALLADPGRQRHRKQQEDADTGRALKILRALPAAFLYRYSSSADTPSGRVEKFTFSPNREFSPPDLETQILTSMAGEIWIDPAHMRVTRLEGHLQQDVNFAWWFPGRLNKGGWIVIEQADVGSGQWRTVRFQMQMSIKLVFRTRSFDTIEEESRFAPLPADLGYRQAIQMLRASPEGTTGEQAMPQAASAKRP